MNHLVKISVRNLVEYVLRSGSIDTTFKNSSSMLEGIKAHQKVQSRQNQQYEKEVSLKTQIEYEGICFQIEGRCDGIIKEDGIIIDEIKSTVKSLDWIKENEYPTHWAQAKLYAYMYAKENHIDNITVQLTYFQVEDEEEKKFRQIIDFNALEEFVLDLIKKYVGFAKFKDNWSQIRKESIKNLSFPFKDYREGQRKMAVSVYRTILDKKRLFIQGPTGIGKTISTIFPAIKALGEGKVEKITYLTAKTITRTVAQNTYQILKHQGARMKVIVLTAKEKICFEEEVHCSKETCSYADGHFDRLNDALMDILKNEDVMDRDIISAYAKKHRVCPFEYSLSLSSIGDCVICDYNYVFDPKVSLKILEESKKKQVLLIDESHNLVDRSRMMFSSSIDKSKFLKVKKIIKDKEKSAVKILNQLNRNFLKIKKECIKKEQWISSSLPNPIIKSLHKWINKCEEILSKGQEFEGYDEFLELYFESLDYIRISKLYNETYQTIITNKGKDMNIELFCLDPSKILRGITKAYKSSIFFSATLMPIAYYKEILGAEESDYHISFLSPFDPKHLDIYVHPISTRYKDREKTCGQIVEKIGNYLKQSPGHYLIFFPSYVYMQKAYEIFKEKYENIESMIQHVDLSEEDREVFLKRFEQEDQKSLAGFCVLGGLFSEGIDLKGDRLHGTIIVGVGLPQIGMKKDLIQSFYDQWGKKGYDYAYVYPGMNKVLQAAGRVIRTEKDTGILVLIDDRFLSRKYQGLFPVEWKHYKRMTK